MEFVVIENKIKPTFIQISYDSNLLKAILRHLISFSESDELIGHFREIYLNFDDIHYQTIKLLE